MDGWTDGHISRWMGMSHAVDIEKIFIGVEFALVGQIQMSRYRWIDTDWRPAMSLMGLV